MKIFMNLPRASTIEVGVDLGLPGHLVHVDEALAVEEDEAPSA